MGRFLRKIRAKVEDKVKKHITDQSSARDAFEEKKRES